MTDAEKEAAKAAAAERRKKEKGSYRTGGQIGYVFDNSELYVPDPTPGAPKGSVLPWQGSDANFDKLFGKIERTVKSATDGYVGTAKKEDIGGALAREMFVEEDKSDKIRNALEFRKKGFQSGEYGYLAASSQFVQDEDYHYEGLRATRKIVGSENRRKLAEIAEQNAYKVKYSTDPGSRDYADIQYRFPRDTFNRYEQEHDDYLAAKKAGVPWTGSKDARLTAEARAESEVFGDVIDSSRKAEKQRLKEAEKKRIEKLEKENAKKGEDFTDDHKKYSSVVDKNATPDMLHSQYEKLDQDKKDKRNKQKQKDEEEAEKKEEKRQWKSIGKQCLVILVAILDMCRRLLSAAMDRAVEAHEDGKNGRSVGANLSEVRAYKSVERTRKLPEGTFLNYYQDIQEKFGDERHLDENAIREIAPYLSPHIERLIRSGNADADVVGNDLLDNLMRLVKEHKNWSGDDVGSAEEAFINLYNSMKRAFPEGAEIFKSMYLVNQTGIDAGKASTVEDYIKSGGVKSNKSAAELADLEETGQILSKMNTRLKTIIDDWLDELATTFKGVFNGISDTDIGLDDEQKLEKHTRIYNESVVIAENLKKEQAGIETALSAFAGQNGIDLSKDGYNSMHDLTMKVATGLYAGDIKKKPELLRFLAIPEVRALLEMYDVNNAAYLKAMENVAKGKGKQMLKTEDISDVATQTARQAKVRERLTSKAVEGYAGRSVTAQYSQAVAYDKDRARSGDQKGILNRLFKNLFDDTGYQFSYADIADVVAQYYPERNFKYRKVDNMDDLLTLYTTSKKGADSDTRAGISGAGKTFDDVVAEIRNQTKDINNQRKQENKKRKAANKQAKKTGGEQQELLPMLPGLELLHPFMSNEEKAEKVQAYLQEHPEIQISTDFITASSGKHGAQFKSIDLSDAELANLAKILRQRQGDIGAQYSLYVSAAAEGNIFNTAAAEIKDKLAALNLNLADVNLRTEAVARDEQTVVFRAVLVDADGNNEREIWSNEHETKSSGLRKGMPIEIPLIFENGG